jgi:hypothetical protein
MKGRFWYYVVISCITMIDNAYCKFGMIIPLIYLPEKERRRKE